MQFLNDSFLLPKTISIQPSQLHGEVSAPASKSAMQRACAAALLKEGKSRLYNPGQSYDDCAALSIIQALGATIEHEKDGSISIISNGVQPITNILQCGESGLSIRMFTPIAALSSNTIVIKGEGSLLKRPMGLFDEILPQLNVQIWSNNGYLPLQLKGPLKPRSISIDGSLSSQFLTGLLMAFAGAKANKVTISVHNLNSKPYIQLTLQIMQHFGLCIPLNERFEHFYFENNFTQATSSSLCTYSVEGDWSGAAFLLVAGAIAGPITVKGLQFNSVQADKAIVQALQLTGCSIQQEKDSITVEPSALFAFQFNATDCPDLFPPLAVLAAYCKGTSIIEGVHRLTHKESNRAEALQQELGKMGVQVEIEKNNMKIHGGNVLKGSAHFFSHNDHRIAMAGAVAALKAKGATVIEHADAIKKSYPSFYTHLQQLGASLEMIEENRNIIQK